MNLVIIEGAGKVKKISGILGNDYKVIASCGHIETLKNDCYDQTGIDKELNYHFEFINGKAKVIKEINEIGSKSNNIYIASDPDREGEGIAWHLFNKLNSQNKQKAKRITFNEISEKAIKEALENPKTIDKDYVNAYLTRIALDKKIGYGLSKFLQQKINLKSAGRVQSVVLKLIDEREKEIANFVPKTCYYLAPVINDVELTHFKSNNDVNLFTNNDDKKLSFLNITEAQEYITNYLSKDFLLSDIKDAEIKYVYPSAPFKTSSAQQTLIKQLKVSSKIVEQILQKLYENGYITYPRTDSTRISDDFCNEAYNFVKMQYPNLANNDFRFNKSKSSSGAQDAHEAIRVLHLDKLSSSLENEITDSLKDLIIKAYEIIYNQTIIQFMNPTKKEITEFEFTNNNDFFVATSEIILDQGFNEYLLTQQQNKNISFELNKTYNANDDKDIIKSSTTQPPKPFTQSSLIKKLEQLEIGRPSTYASSVEVNNVRGYTSMDKKEVLSTTPDGRKAIDLLNNNWNELINYTFTAEMEKSLDKIAENKLDFKKYLTEFLDIFETKLYKYISLKVLPEKQEYQVVGKCPKCGNDVILKELSNNKKIEQCIERKYNIKTKQNYGCDYYKFI